MMVYLFCFYLPQLTLFTCTYPLFFIISVGNELIGEIPPEISQLRFLQYIAFNGNCLYGTIPSEMGSMPNLLSLELQGNGLSGEIPLELGNADKLQLLNVALQFQYAYQCAASDGRIVNTMFQKGNPENGYNWGLMGSTLGDNVNKWKSMKGIHLVSFGTVLCFSCM